MRRTVVPAVEVAAVIAAVALGGRLGIIVLLALASVALALRGRRWQAAEDGDRGSAWALAGGAVVGALALAGALAVSPAVLGATGAAVEWSTAPVVRGSAVQLAVAVVPAIALALAAELVFRRWLLERVAAAVRAAGEPALLATAAGVIVAAIVEAAVLPAGDAGGWGRLGTVLGSCGLGIVYGAAGGRVAASIGARTVFEVGALVVQALRLVG